MAEADELSGCFVGAAIIDWYQPDGVPRCLVVPSTWERRQGKPPDIKFPGGMHKVSDRDFEATIRRELPDETGLRVRQGAKLLSPFGYKLDEQWKYLFILKRKQCRGRLRKGEIPDGESILSEPQWLTYTELVEKLFHTHRFWLPIIKEKMEKRPLR